MGLLAVALSCLALWMTPLSPPEAAERVVIVLPGETLPSPYATALEALEGELGSRRRTTERLVLPATADEAQVAGLVRSLAAKDPAAVVALGSTVLARLKGQPLGAPLLFSMVLNPTHIDPQGTTPGVRLDCDPSEVFQIFSELFPRRRRIGIVYDASVSSTLLDQLKTPAARLGLELEARAIHSTEELFRGQRELASLVDAFLLVPDTYSASDAAFQGIRDLSFKWRLPVVALKSSAVRDGAAFCFVIDYAEVGRQTAELVERALAGTAGLGHGWPRRTRLCINRKSLQIMGAEGLSAKIEQRVVLSYPEEERR
ncbi:MAG: ABC transporter substrate binding protein [Planctomycetota bacterium]